MLDFPDLMVCPELREMLAGPFPDDPERWEMLERMVCLVCLELREILVSTDHQERTERMVFPDDQATMVETGLTDRRETEVTLETLVPPELPVWSERRETEETQV